MNRALPDRLRQRLDALAPLWRDGLPAMARGLAVGLLAVTLNPVLFALSVVSLALIPAAGLGFAAFPIVTSVVRWRANLSRRLAARSGVPIPVPYRPVPARAVYGTWERFRQVVSDPATWLDFAWLVPGAIAGTVCGLLAACLPLYGVEGMLGIAILLSASIDWYGYGIFWPIDNPVEALLTIPMGVLFLVVGLAGARWLTWIEATFTSYFLRPTPSSVLAQQVRHLTVTRADAVDTQAAELRRIERDLHDGAQARLVSLSMNIGMAEELLRRDPEAAAALLAEARQSSGLALADLRGLVRGIHPPVLAERGLDGAVRALALTVPLHIAVDVDLPARPPAPIESAAYFAVAEALTNVAKHSGASTAWVRLTHHDGRLAIQIGDNGRGGANAEAGGGLRGIERRLAAFDGIMSVSSPPGGPTVVTMELPCALSSPRTSPSSGTA
ncbi:sensor histidine kinase [Luedemannella helvata]|uniref:histidine kinase n=1 Tax=Luedemannella helvata TaxID=349315 RepID=A0ABN2JS42_9ACTN